MRAGRLHQKISIKQKIAIENDLGEEEYAWQTINGGADIWAGVEHLSGREYTEAKQIHTDITARIVLRHMNGITANMRVYHVDIIYEIVSPPIDKYFKQRELQLMCKQIDPAAIDAAWGG